MNAPQSTSPRRRLQELLAIPDNQRSDAEWDELNELEISLAPGNREGAPDPNLRRPTPSTGLGSKPSRGPRPGGRQQKPGGQGKPPPQQKPAVQPKNTAAAPPPLPPAGEDAPAKKPARKFRKRSPKPNTTPTPQSE